MIEFMNKSWALPETLFRAINAWITGDREFAGSRTMGGALAEFAGHVSGVEAPKNVYVHLAARGSSEESGGPKVAIIPLQGLITPQGSLLSLLFGLGGGGLQAFRSNLREAVNDPDVKSIVLNVDSPGGLVDLVPETAAELRAAREAKPVVAVASTMAASAAYWLASQADELIVTPSGEVGSIGVYMAHTEFSKMDEKLGINTTLISAGKFKTEGNDSEPLTSAAKKAMQDDVNHFYDMFTADVAAGRGVSQAKVKGGMGQGRMVNAENAVSEGMADRVGTLEEVVAAQVSSSSSAPRARVTPVQFSFDEDAVARMVAKALRAETAETPPSSEEGGSEDEDGEGPPEVESGDEEGETGPPEVEPEPEPEPESTDEGETEDRAATIDALLHLT